jgi:hypothetical protein
MPHAHRCAYQAFQAVSDDNHPIHYEVEYARLHKNTAPVVHGFLEEVHAGDTVYSALEIIGLTPKRGSGQVTTRATMIISAANSSYLENTSILYADRLVCIGSNNRQAQRFSVGEYHRPWEQVGIEHACLRNSVD